MTRVTTIRDESQTVLRGMEEALLHRMNPRTALGDNGRRFRGMSLVELCRELLAATGVQTKGMDRVAVAAAALSQRSAGMGTTADLATLLSNVANKRLRDAFDENPGTFRMWARQGPSATSFKPITVVQASGVPDLLQVNEAGEFKYGVMRDSGETYSLLTFGRVVSVSRQSIVNDDVRAFDRVLSGFGASAARLENRMVYAQITSNPLMSDGTALFHAAHGNLGTGAPSALQVSALSAARAAMRLQKGLLGEELDLAPRTLIVPAALEHTAYQLTSSNYVPATTAEVNEFRQGGRTSLMPVVEPLLDAVSATAWYLAAGSGFDTVEFCYLEGGDAPSIDVEHGFEVDGISMRCRHDFAAKVIDWRGLYKANGA